MFRSLNVRRFVLILSLAVASTFAASASADDPHTPQELREAADRLEATARENLASGIEHLRPAAEMFREMALSYRDEAAWREKAAELEAQAERSEKAGHAEEAKRLREEAIQSQAEAAIAAADREARLQERQVRDELRTKLQIMADRARILRQEGAFDDAQQIETQVREQLRTNGLDPRLERAADLRRMALEARFEGAHENAAMYDREANRVFAEATGREEVAGEPSDAEKLAADERAALQSEVKALRTEVAALKAAVEELRSSGSTKESPAAAEAQ